MRIVSHACADQRGFTLAELLMALALVGMLMAGTLTIIMTGNETYLTGADQVEAQQAARVALERMVREIRGAGYNPTGQPCLPLSNCPIVGDPTADTLTATTLVIQNDTNGNGTFQTTERILYTLNGTNLQRKEGTGAQETIVGGIQALTFTYWDEADVEITPGPSKPVQNIRTVRISLTTQPETQPVEWQTGKVSVTMSDRIRLRNR